MDLGHELIRRQLFFRRELSERVYWLITVRWFIAGAGLLLTLGAARLGFGLPVVRLVAVFLLVFLFNLFFVWLGRRLERLPSEDVRRFQLFAHTQVSLDLASLFLVIILTGGLASPLLIFLTFHVVLISLLLSPLSCLVYTLLIISVLTALALFGGSLPLFTIPGWALSQRWTTYLPLAAGLMVLAYLTTSLKLTLRFKGREMLRVSRELELSTTKLTSIYEMVKEIGGLNNFQELLDSAVRNAARIMGVKACSIKLLDQEQNSLRFAATYGLSQDYLSAERIDLSRSNVNRSIIEGSLFAIGQIEEKDHFQYPENIRKEGIASMLCLPLKYESRTLGVFCVYSGRQEHFIESDVSHFSMMSDLTALAMERLRREMARTWFLNKSAHQLRSPLAAVQSMLKVFTGGYLGDLNDQQLQTAQRCEQRLALLIDVVNDLLRVAADRESFGNRAFHPVDPAAVLASVRDLYAGQAREKGLEFVVQVDPDLPRVNGLEEMFDDLLTNMVSNAIKYTPAGGRVTVGLTRQDDGRVCIQVADTGIGIPEAERARLFTEFFRGEEAKEVSEAGTGLGLVIVKEITARLGGEISVTSQPGQGSRFTCLLPPAP